MTDMSDGIERKPLDHYLALRYPFAVHADPGSGYVIVFPDLPGCVSQAETLQEITRMAEDVRTGWIETEYGEGRSIPEPSYQEYSGKFNLRLPKSLHRTLAEAAAQDGVSLNQYVIMLLSNGNARREEERKGERLNVADILSEDAVLLTQQDRERKFQRASISSR